ncbi:MBL fold metallo-hydrolase [Arthrobacter sp. GMC3]|uniref:MBL fold metallo-hydrolase n=1 Tax=Arthrobacter sp. GMC3 TaxID=2058894 RepID=UPI000CE3BC7E|nr:MBL fold metallo-hydrolase [Arthrobacter sp. GMC3]
MPETSTLLRDFPNYTVRRAVVSEMANNVYLITKKDTGAQILIDAADDIAAINSLLLDGAADAQVPATLTTIATTHQHWDHVRALADLVKASGATTVSGVEDASGIQAGTGVAIDQTVVDGDELTAAGGSLRLSCIGLRGHTPGSIAYVLADVGGATLIFSGDSLFPGGVGNTEGDPARFTSLLDDVQERLFDRYDDDAVVLPGHGAETTLGAERPSLGQWRERGW